VRHSREFAGAGLYLPDNDFCEGVREFFNGFFNGVFVAAKHVADKLCRVV